MTQDNIMNNISYFYLIFIPGISFIGFLGLNMVKEYIDMVSNDKIEKGDNIETSDKIEINGKIEKDDKID